MKKSKLMKQMVAGGYMSNTKQKRLTRENNSSNSNTNTEKKRINKLKQNNYTK